MIKTLTLPPRRVILIMLLMIVLTNLPYIVARLTTPAGMHFSGAILDLTDFQSHLTRMQFGQRGSWLYQLAFTAEPHEPLLVQTFYVMLGQIARVSGLSLDVVWALMEIFLPPKAVTWALLLCLFGGGMGYLLFLIPGAATSLSPLEFWLLDGYIFLASFTFPHFSAVVTMMALSFRAIQTWTLEGRGLIILYIASLCVILIEPFDIALVDIVLIIVCLWRIYRKQSPALKTMAGLVLIGITHLTVVGYEWLTLYHLPIWESFIEQNVFAAFPPLYYLLGYSPALVTAVAGAIMVIRRRDDRWLIPVLWLGEVMILIYSPFAQRPRFTQGVYVPIAMLSVYWLATCAIPWLRTRTRRYRTVLAMYGVAAVLSTITLIAWLLLATQSRANTDLYVPDDIWTAWDWIKTNTPQDSVILSGFESGTSIAGRGERRVVIGHWVETAEFDAKMVLVQRFFSAETTDDWRLEFLRSQSADYVWYSDREKSLGSWQPAQADYLQEVYAVPDVTIYAVNMGR